MQNPYEEIIKLLDNQAIKYEILEHEPVYTSEQAAKVRGLSLKQGAKSLLLKADGEFILAVLPGNRKLDSKKLKQKLGVKNLRFATPDEVKKIMGCEIGACYPIGTIIGIKPLVEISFAQNEIISFNPGVHNKSIKIHWVNYQRLTNPELLDIAL